MYSRFADKPQKEKIVKMYTKKLLSLVNAVVKKRDF